MLIYDPVEHQYPCCHNCCLHALIYIHCGNHRYQIVQIFGNQDEGMRTVELSFEIFIYSSFNTFWMTDGYSADIIVYEIMSML